MSEITLAGDWHDDDAQIVADQLDPAPPLTADEKALDVVHPVKLDAAKLTRLIASTETMTQGDQPRRIAGLNPERKSLAVMLVQETTPRTTRIASKSTFLYSKLTSAVLPLNVPIELGAYNDNLFVINDGNPLDTSTISTVEVTS